MKYASDLGLCIAVPLIAAGLWYFPTLNPTNSLSPSQETGTLGFGTSSISCGNEVAWSKDDQKLLVRCRGGSDLESQLVLLDLAGKTIQAPFEKVGGDSPNAAALCADDRYMLIGTPLGRLLRIDSFEETECQTIVDLQRECAVSSVAVADDGTLIAGGMANGKIYVVSGDYDPGDEIVVLKSAESQSSIGHLQFSRDGKQLLAARNDGQMDLWDVPSRRLLRNFPGHPDVTKGAAFLGDGRRIISAGLDDTVRIWDIESGREIWRGDFGLEGLQALDVSRDGRLAAWAGNSRRIVVWDIELGTRKLQIDSPLPLIYCISFSRDGTRLAAVGRSGGVHIFDTRTGEATTKLSFEAR